MTPSPFRRAYLVLAGMAAGIAFAVAMVAVVGWPASEVVIVAGVVLGIGIAAFGGAFATTRRTHGSVAVREVGA